jgi:hypothetical protein
MALASDVLYVKETCFATPSEEIMRYLHMICIQRDKEALAKTLALGVISGEIVIWEPGKKLFLVRKVNDTEYVVRPEGDPRCYHVVAYCLKYADGREALPESRDSVADYLMGKP